MKAKFVCIDDKNFLIIKGTITIVFNEFFCIVVPDDAIVVSRS